MIAVSMFALVNTYVLTPLPESNLVGFKTSYERTEFGSKVFIGVLPFDDIQAGTKDSDESYDTYCQACRFHGV